MPAVDLPLRGDVDFPRNVVRSIGGVRLTRLPSGAPTSGYHQAGDVHTDQNGVAYVCSASGTPGTWGTLASTATKFSKYNNVATAGLGIASVYGYNRSTGATTNVASVATYTPAADSSCLVSGNVNVTTSVLHNFTVTCTYTDETNVSRTLTMAFTQLTGSTLLTAITNVTGAGPYESIPFHIRAKAATAITIASAGAGGFSNVVYNIEAAIVALA